MRRLLIPAAVAALALGAAPAHAQTIAITGGKVYPVSGAPIENGTVLMRDGKIVAVGANVTVPADAQRVDATGKWVTPGIVNPATQLGLVEVGAVGETRDARARGRDQIAAGFRAWEGMNPASVQIAPAREDGVTTVVIHPSGGLIAGQSAVLDLVDGSLGDMLVRGPVAMVGEIGESGPAGVGARGEVLARLRGLLEDTRAFRAHRAQYETGDTREYAASRLDLEAMIPVLEGRLPLLLAVDRASDIESALAIAKEYGLKIMIAGGAESWRVADKLAAAKVPVLAGSMVNIPGSFSALGTRQETPALLQKAGVTVAILGTGNDPDAQNVRNLRYDAGTAVAYGMSWDDALRAITLVPAQMFGIADRVGTLQPGKVANVVIWSGDPFEFSSRPQHVYVHGREFTAPSRQEQLEQRYRTLPPKYIEAPAP